MPRPPRPDLVPEIRLPDVREAERRASDAAGNAYRTKVFRRDQPATNDGYVQIYQALYLRLAEIRETRPGYIDEGLLLAMMQDCDFASAEPKMHHCEPFIKDGEIVHRLFKIGCRVRKTQQQIADDYPCSRQHVNEQVRRMKEVGLIVNQGRGWYEFSALYVWCGPPQLQRAYLRVQRVADGLTVRQGDKVIMQAATMDDGEQR